MPAKKPKVVLTCRHCGRTFDAFPCVAETRKYCSRRCRYDFMATGAGPYRGHAGGHRAEHLRIAINVLGHPLPVNAEVHHVNGNGRDNRHSNLVICENRAYHFLLHLRAKILILGGDPDTQRICSGCKVPVNIEGFGSFKPGPSGSPHRICLACAASRADARRRRRGIPQRVRKIAIAASVLFLLGLAAPVSALVLLPPSPAPCGCLWDILNTSAPSDHEQTLAEYEEDLRHEPEAPNWILVCVPSLTPPTPTPFVPPLVPPGTPTPRGTPPPPGSSPLPPVPVPPTEPPIQTAESATAALLLVGLLALRVRW